MIKYPDLDDDERLSEEADFLSNKNDYVKFLNRLYGEEGIDLSLYKQNQLRRRMNMFIRGSGQKGYCEFLDVVKKDIAVYRSFIDRITINVSEFFRNPDKFGILESRFLIPLLKRKREPLIWSAGCSSGEEAYTLALLLEKHGAPPSVKVLGWDFDANILKLAQAGVYDGKALSGVPKDLLAKYFTRLDGDKYEVGATLKRRVRLERHNLLEDRFPTGADMILCRNVVIYFNERAKHELFRRFGEALDKEGVLFIGASERVPNADEAKLFSPEIFFYQRSDGATVTDSPRRPLSLSRSPAV
jgi:chemotaxis protein methyltransferase CheR